MKSAVSLRFDERSDPMRAFRKLDANNSGELGDKPSCHFRKSSY
jgi:hypothetical protein